MSSGEQHRVGQETASELTCPHCRKSFTTEPLPRPTARQRGYKCPHCRLFVPLDRAVDAPLARDDQS